MIDVSKLHYKIDISGMTGGTITEVGVMPTGLNELSFFTGANQNVTIQSGSNYNVNQSVADLIQALAGWSSSPFAGGSALDITHDYLYVISIAGAQGTVGTVNTPRAPAGSPPATIIG